jgi:hypothetical protein
MEPSIHPLTALRNLNYLVLVSGRNFTEGDDKMSENDVLANQKTILDHQATILANQKTILENQAAIKHNQDALQKIIENQERILAAIKK